ncbi:Clp protease [Leucobacter insecticola]|uniref:Clp protease n=1 Tax=Leucobacter insecticola TaxID=2714934 RepID=A0A6G8FKW9_9MICO|nr:Clp protease N-terminal domain-containing protein [Leucobacter insecticola]QIM16722.1 Clp protease [Leucobacter insecticola]
MSKLLDIARTSQQLTIAAGEEASRSGQRTIDFDHLFLALVLSDQAAGQVLRGLGITIQAARDAVESYHREQLDALGLGAAMPEAGDIVFHETGGYELNRRSQEVFQNAGKGKKAGDAAAVLRELLDDPSGMIPSILDRLDTTPEEVRTRLDQAASIPELATKHVRAPKQPGLASSRIEAFVPASIEQVWELLVDPEHMPQWDMYTGSVELPEDPDTGLGSRQGDSWIARARTESPDGKPLRVNENYVRRQVTVTHVSPRSKIAWRIAHMDTPRPIAMRTEIALSPAAGGTQLTITVSHERRNPLRWFVSAPCGASPAGST